MGTWSLWSEVLNKLGGYTGVSMILIMLVVGRATDLSQEPH